MARKSSDRLFVLIKSLSKRDKRAVRGSLEKGSKHTLLFELLDKQKVFDDDKVMAKLYGKIDERNAYSKLKKYLFNAISEVLVILDSQSYHKENIRFQTAIAKALFKRGLYEKSMSILDHQGEVSLEYEYYDLKLEIWRTQVDQAQSRNDTSFLATRKQAFQNEMDNLLTSYSDETKAWKHFNQSQQILKTTYAVVDDFDENVIREIETMQEVQNTYASCLQLMAKNNSAQLRRDFQAMSEIANSLYDYTSSITVQNNPIIHLDLWCKIIWGNYVVLNFDKTFESCEQLFKLIQSTQINSQLQELYYDKYYLFQLTVCHSAGYFERGVNLIKTICQERSGFHQGSYSVNAHHLFICLFFGAERYQDVSHWIASFKTSLKESKRLDLKRFLNWIEIFYHIEQNDVVYLESVIRSFSRSIKKDPNYFRSTAEKALHTFVRNICNVGKAEKEHFVQFKSSLEQAFADKKERFIQDFFHIIDWTNSKINRTNFETEVRKSMKTL